MVATFLMQEASARWVCLSVRPSVFPSVCHTFLQICEVHACDVLLFIGRLCPNMGVLMNKYIELKIDLYIDVRSLQTLRDPVHRRNVRE